MKKREDRKEIGKGEKGRMEMEKWEWEKRNRERKGIKAIGKRGNVERNLKRG